MSRSRNIKPGFFKNEVLVGLPFEFRLLFIGLWTVADRAGRFEDRPIKIKMEIFPADNVDVDEGLNSLHEGGFITRYVVDGVKYCQIEAWSKHQNPHIKEAASLIPQQVKPGASTMQEPFEPDSSTSQAVLIPDSLNLIPDSNKEPAPKGASRGIGLDAWLESIGEEEAIPAEDAIFAYAKKAGIPLDFLELSWNRFCEDMTERKTRKKDWRAHYRNAVKGNWYKIWWLDNDGVYQLTTVGKQAKAVLS